MNKTVAIFCSSRHSYGRLYSIIKAIENSEDIDCQLIISGEILSSEFTGLLDDIESDGLDVSCQVCLPEFKGESTLNYNFANIMIDLSKSFSLLKPDLVLLYGLEVDNLAAAQTSYFQKIPIITLFDGKYDCLSNDESYISSSLSKLSELNFCFNKCLLMCGNEKYELAGSFVSESLNFLVAQDINRLMKKYILEKGAKLIILNLENIQNLGDNMLLNLKKLLNILRRGDFQVVINYSKIDKDNERLITILSEYKSEKSFRIINSISYRDYVGLLSLASLVISNKINNSYEADILLKPFLFLDTQDSSLIMKDAKPGIFFNDKLSDDCIRDSIENKISEQIVENTTTYLTNVSKEFINRLRLLLKE